MAALLFALGLVLALFISALGLMMALVGMLMGAKKAEPGRKAPGAMRGAMPGMVLTVVAVLVAIGLERGQAAWVTHRMIGQLVLWESTVDALETERDFTGDGYSLRESSLPQRICDSIRAEPGVLDGYPQWPDPDPDSELEHHHSGWVPTPLDPALIEAFEAMHHPSWELPDEARAAWTARLDAALSSPGAVVAWNLRRIVYEDDGHVSDLDLLLIELEPCAMVWVNHNT